jgi:hypothetical protein
MRPLVRTRPVAVVGGLAVALIAVLLLRGDIDLIGAGQRALALVAIVVVVERLLLPLAQLMVGEPAVPPEDEPARGSVP